MVEESVQQACEQFLKGLREPIHLSPGQHPSYVGVQGLEAKPWWQPPELFAILQTVRMDTILDEFQTLSKTRSATEKMHAQEGHWIRFGLLEEGEWLSENCELCPHTVGMLKQLNLCECSLGHAYFSVIGGNTTIEEHYGPTNAKLRVQVCLVAGQGCTITVGGVTLPYETDSVMVFDDSFLHSVRNKADSERVVLLFDIWHPGLSPTSVALLTKTFSKEALVKFESETGGRRKSVQEKKNDMLNRIQLVPAAAMQNVLCVYLSVRELCLLGSTCKYLWGMTNSGEVWRALALRDRGDIALPVIPVASSPVPASWFRSPFGSSAPAPAFCWKTWYRNEIYCAFARIDSSSPEAKNHDGLLKLLMIGQNGVGKSCFVLRFVEDTFSSHYISTIGVDFKICVVKSPRGIWKLQIWDTAGPERFRTITSAYYRGAQGIFVMFNVSDRESFVQARYWFKEIERFGSSCKVLLLGTQIDLERKVSVAEGKALADELKIPYAECSAKTGEGVSQAVYTLFRSCDPVSLKAVPPPPPKTQKTNSNSKCAVQ